MGQGLFYFHAKKLCIRKSTQLFLFSENVVGYAVVPVNIRLAVYVKSVVFGEHFCPELAVSLICPVVFIESAPEYRSSVYVEVLLGHNSAVIGFDIHNAYGVVSPAAYRHDVSSHYIKKKILVRGIYFCPSSGDVSLL